jgi:hypothetical protein
MNDKIIVIDNLSEGVLCECISPSIAQSVSLGFINSSIKILPSSIPWLEKDYYYNFNDSSSYFQFRTMKILKLSDHLITEEFIAMRFLAQIRNSFHAAWETKCKQFLYNRNHDYFNLPLMEAYLCNQLDKCDVNNEYYTQAIHEWAAISEVDVKVAYQELKIKTESLGLQYIRNNAIYHRYVFLLNQCKNKEDLTKTIIDGMDHLIGRSQI